MLLQVARNRPIEWVWPIEYSRIMSTVAEIKRAVRQLPPRRKQALARWLWTEMSDWLSDEAMMALAAEGARALDQREEEGVPRPKRTRSQKLTWAQTYQQMAQAEEDWSDWER